MAKKHSTAIKPIRVIALEWTRPMGSKPFEEVLEQKLIEITEQYPQYTIVSVFSPFNRNPTSYLHPDSYTTGTQLLYNVPPDYFVVLRWDGERDE